MALTPAIARVADRARYYWWGSKIPGIAHQFDGFMGLSPSFWSTAEIIEQAQLHTGLTDFGDESFEEPLEVLTKGYRDEASLGVFGRIAARWDTLRFLCNLLMLRAAEQESSAVLQESIEQPIFITGMPRSGTTFLHNLLMQDRANLAVLCWETIYPCQAPNARHVASDTLSARVQRQLNSFAWFAPGIRRVHRLNATSPQECTEILAHVFQSLRFDTTHRVPSYRRWLDNVGHRAAYRFHRRFLQHLQYRKGPGRWILKSPDHVFALDAIRDLYPDARFIFMHRNPLEVLPSVAQLTEILRRPFTRHVDRREIGRQVSERLGLGAEILLAAAGQASSHTVAHLNFDSLVRNPSGAVAALYERFGLTFSDSFAERLRRVIAEWPGRYSRNRVSLEEFGLSAETERDRFGAYIDHFGFCGAIPKR